MNRTKYLLTFWLLLTMGLLLLVTVVASLEKNVLIGFSEVGSQPWGLATLLDAYFAFIIVALWIWYREAHWLKGGLWTVAICLLGNFAIATYILIQIYKTPNFQIKHLFQTSKERDSKTSIS